MGNSRRFKRAMKGGRSRAGLEGGYGGVKMSEVLLEFAEPMLRGLSLPDDREAFTAALRVAGLLWNEAVHPHPDGRQELYVRLNEAMGGPRDPQMEKLFDAVIARRRRLYSSLDRIITGIHVSVGEDGDCTVRVISAV